MNEDKKTGSQRQPNLEKSRWICSKTDAMDVMKEQLQEESLQAMLEYSEDSLKQCRE